MKTSLYSNAEQAGRRGEDAVALGSNPVLSSLVFASFTGKCYVGRIILIAKNNLGYVW